LYTLFIHFVDIIVPILEEYSFRDVWRYSVRGIKRGGKENKVSKKKNRVKLIANPGAGKPSEAEGKLKQVIGWLEEQGLKVDSALAKPKENATPIAKRAAKDGYKVVIAVGGDGTIEAVMRGLVGSKVRLGIIPTGTQNNLAKSLGIPLDLKEACALAASDSTLKLDVGQVKTKKGKKLYFMEMATVGLAAALYPPANKLANGKFSKIIDAASTLVRQETKPKVTLTMNDESKIRINTMLAIVANTPIFGRSFLVAPEASVQDGLLDISVYPDFNKTQLIGYFAAVMDGGYSGEGKVQQYQARKVKIKTSPKLDVMADGISLGQGAIKIKAKPRALRVITTQPKTGAEIPQAIEEAKETPKPKPAEEASVVNLG
jgi:diacylglycerol kinase (ATP)